VSFFAPPARAAEVVAGVRRRQKEVASKLNVDVVALDDDAELEQLPQVDAIADTVGGETIRKLLSKVKPGGTIGSVLGEPPGARERGLAVHALRSHPDSRRLAELAQSVAAGKLMIPIATRLPLSEIREAHTLAEQGARGKIVLRIR
jgi:NADPH:quinone reductase-like Zn-dependent oxidoreductase